MRVSEEVKSVILFFTMFVILSTCRLQAELPQEIATDRPDFTESELVVPVDMLQVENGLTYSRDADDYNLGLPESLIRIGAFDKLELRVGAPLYNVQKVDGESGNGWGDTYLGFKYQADNLFGGDTGFSFIPAIFVPTGDKGYSSDDWDPELKVCYARDINDTFSLAGMSFIAWPTELSSVGIQQDESKSRRNWSYQQTVTLGMAVTDKVGAFLEYAGTVVEFGSPEHLLHQGFTYLLDDNNLLDVHYGLGVNESASGDFLAMGWSFRF
jgi:hypothetical protein